jgi:hypothetical protein
MLAKDLPQLFFVFSKMTFKVAQQPFTFKHRNFADMKLIYPFSFAVILDAPQILNEVLKCCARKLSA